jgi:hypothetical protein
MLHSSVCRWFIVISSIIFFLSFDGPCFFHAQAFVISTTIRTTRSTSNRSRIHVSETIHRTTFNILKQSTKQKSKSFPLFQSIYSPNALKRRNITIPLLNINDPNIIVPLPAAHLPNELTSLNIYGLQLQAPIHKMMIQETMSKFDSSRQGIPNVMSEEQGRTYEPIYGHLVQTSLQSQEETDQLVGVIGCAAEIIIATSSQEIKINNMNKDSIPLTDMNTIGKNEMDGDDSLTVLCKGSFRFIVKEVTQTFPFPIAIVDELMDDEPDMSRSVQEYNDFKEVEEEDDEEEEEDEDHDMYQYIDPSDLIPRTMAAMKTIVDQKINTQPKSISPLEQAILEEKGFSQGALNDREQDQAEEMGAILDIFASSMLDIAPTRLERMYSVAMLAAEFAGVGNDIREQILITTNGVERLRIVLKEIEKVISMVSVAKLTEEITEQNDSKDLKVGVPTLPPWSKNIRKGTNIEYFWNEIEGWCTGKVVEDPIMILDELILVILFDDGEMHRLPFQGDEKARWRPG